jgi:hypothetical protein
VASAVGGRVGNTRRLASVERYDLANGAWLQAAAMATARSDFGLCKLSDGDVYAIGGLSFDEVTLASVERYDSSLDTWSVTPPLPRPRYSHCACARCNAIYILGGTEQDEEGEEDIVNSVLKFDCRMQIWSEVAPMPEKRNEAGVCVVGGDIYIFGGEIEHDAPTSTTYRFSSETNEWATLAPMPEAKSLYSISMLDGFIYVMGSHNEDDDPINSVHRFDPVANLWSTVAPMSVARMTLGSFVLGGSMYAVGGYDGNNSLSSMERYSVASDSWSEVLGGELSTARDLLKAIVVRLEPDLFDTLIAKARNGRAVIVIRILMRRNLIYL